MDFLKAIEPWSAPKIAETLECPQRIVYAWKAGERHPRPWVQKLILDRMKRVKPDVEESRKSSEK